MPPRFSASLDSAHPAQLLPAFLPPRELRHSLLDRGGGASDLPGLLAIVLPSPSAAPILLPSPLRVHPDLPGYEFYIVAGTVLSQAVFTPEPWRYPPPGVNRKVDRYRQFQVRREDGTEAELFADADQVQLREGHRVTLVVAGAGDGYDYVVRFWNHDAPGYSRVVQSAARTVAYAFPGGTGCLGPFVLALFCAKAIFLITGLLLGLVAGGVAGVFFFVAMIARSLRRGAPHRRLRKARMAALLEHLSRIGRALSLPAGDGRGAVPAR